MISTPRRALAALTIAASLALAGGCARMSPVQTDVPYQAGDGVNLTMNKDFDVRGLLVVGGEKADAPGRLVGQFVNNTSETVTVTFGTESGGTVEAKAKPGSTDLSSQSLTLESVPGKAGDLIDVTIDAKGSNDVVQVPVHLPDGAYASFAPTS